MLPVWDSLMHARGHALLLFVPPPPPDRFEVLQDVRNLELCPDFLVQICRPQDVSANSIFRSPGLLVLDTLFKDLTLANQGI